MLSSTLIFATSLVAAASAQMSYSPPGGFDPAKVTPAEKTSWCQGELNSCPMICGGFAKSNKCDSTRLTFECICGNGTVPDVESYMNTLPYFICQANFGQCISNHPNDLDGQRQCQEGRKSCGTLNATSPTTTTTSSSATSTPTQTSSTSPSATSATPSRAAAAHLAQDYSVGLFAAGLAGVLGLFL